MKTSGSGDFSIGSAVWPGVSKLIEECGEVVQVAGKLLGAKGERAHWDGSDLKERLESELGDLVAAINFVTIHCGLDDDAIVRRSVEKIRAFTRWHLDGDPTPGEEPDPGPYRVTVAPCPTVNTEVGDIPRCEPGCEAHGGGRA